jgi:hypothetical protein
MEVPMVTDVKPDARLYEDDLYAWSRRQAELLRQRRFDDLDLDHLIEEVEDVGAGLYRSIRSRIRTIIEHLLMLEHSPAKEPRRGWEETIITQRRDLRDDITPTLRRRLEDEWEQHYEAARASAATALRRHGEDAAAGALPLTWPYTLDRITGDWLP